MPQRGSTSSTRDLPARPHTEQAAASPGATASRGLLVHKGRHKLVRRNSGGGSILSAVARTVAAVDSPKTLRASKRWTRARQGSAAPLPAAATAKQAIQAHSSQSVRQVAVSAPASRAQGVRTAFRWVRSTPARFPTATSRADHIHRQRRAPSGRQIKGSVTGPGRVKVPAKLVRIGGSLYRVSGHGRGQSLKRQETPKSTVKKSAAGKVKGCQH